jgi:hypothetical protein
MPGFLKLGVAKFLKRVKELAGKYLEGREIFRDKFGGR